MVGFLKNFGYLNEDIDARSFKKMLDKFYFVGIIKNFEEDSLCPYHMLGINKFYINRNISNKYVKLGELNNETKKLLVKKIRKI